MKKVIVLACAAFFSGQLMAQSTAKATEATAKEQRADDKPTKLEVVAPIAAAAPEAAKVAPAAITDTKVAAQKVPAAELSKTAPVPALAKPEPIKE